MRQAKNTEVISRVSTAIERSVSYLFERQRPDGSWQDVLSSSPTATSAAIIALHEVDPMRFASLIKEGARWLRQNQHPDGGWGSASDDPANLNSTASAVSALHLTDKDRSWAAVTQGLTYIDTHGGVEAIAKRSRSSLNSICLTLMALADLYNWDRVPYVPIEVIWLPTRLRQQVSTVFAGVLAWGIMCSRTRRSEVAQWLARWLAEPRALRWIENVQAEDGGIEEMPYLCALLVIALQRAGVGMSIIQRALAYVLATRRDDGSWSICRDFEFSSTMFVLLGLEAAGHLHDPAVERVIDWIFRAQHEEPFSPTGCTGGGWGWTTSSGWPNTDDTGNALTLLHRFGVPSNDRHVQLGMQWLLTQQNRSGGWACFLKNCRLPLDPPSPEFTSHAISGLAAYLPDATRRPVIQRALSYYQRIQEPDGRIHSLWYRDSVAGTAFALDAYASVQRSSDPVALACRRWLLVHQHDDGSWGTQDAAEATVEETAWALSALLVGEEPYSQASSEQIACGIEWLLERQAPNGAWPASVVGVYWDSQRYSSDHFANGFALQALGRYQQAMRSADTRTEQVPVARSDSYGIVQ